MRLAVFPVRRAVATLSLALGREAVRLRRVRQAVLAVRPLGQTRARPPQADGRQTQALAPAEPTSEIFRAVTRPTLPTSADRKEGLPKSSFCPNYRTLRYTVLAYIAGNGGSRKKTTGC